MKCNTREGAKICDYFQFQGVPHIFALRPDTQMYYKMWVFGDIYRNGEGIKNFAVKNYDQAYTQGKLPSVNRGEPTWEGFKEWYNSYFMAIMEEGFYDAKTYGLTSNDPIEATNFIYYSTCLFALSPALMMCWSMVAYNQCKKLAER